MRALTHDGFAELWFDDLAALRLSMASPEWQALREPPMTHDSEAMEHADLLRAGDGLEQAHHGEGPQAQLQPPTSAALVRQPALRGPLRARNG